MSKDAVRLFLRRLDPQASVSLDPVSPLMRPAIQWSPFGLVGGAARFETVDNHVRFNRVVRDDRFCRRTFRQTDRVIRPDARPAARPRTRPDAASCGENACAGDKHPPPDPHAAPSVLFFSPVPRYASITRSSAFASSAVPCISTAPSAITTTGSQRRPMKSMSCSIMQNV